MPQPKHTPGPWEMEGPYQLYQSPPVWQIWNKCSTYWIAWVQRADYLLQESEANARLIAAAPELLAALKAALEHGLNDYSSCPAKDIEAVMAQCEAAIAKAEATDASI